MNIGLQPRIHDSVGEGVSIGHLLVLAIRCELLSYFYQLAYHMQDQQGQLLVLHFDILAALGQNILAQGQFVDSVPFPVVNQVADGVV